MPRRPRFASGGYVFHVLNRAAGRRAIFTTEGDYAAFERVLDQAQDIVPMRLLSYSIMSNHWHCVLWPHNDDDLSDFMHWLTLTHTQRWHKANDSFGTGPLYQGRFKSFPVEADDHFLTVCRYVERNPLRANLVRRAQDWRWSSFWQWHNERAGVRLSSWPITRPAGWLDYVNSVETEAELASLRTSVRRGAPFGSATWQSQTAVALGIETTLRPRGRPRK